MEKVSLNATIRKGGKGEAGRLRKQGLIPAVLYGKDYKPNGLAVNEKELESAVRTHAGMNVLLDLSIDGKDKIVTRISDYQADPVKRNFTHVDFNVIDLKRKVAVDVPIVFGGKAKGVKEGGVLVMDRRVLNVKCLPTAIPENITIDINELDIGDGIHINDLKLPEGVECAHEVNFAIVSVVAPMKEEVAAPVVAEGAVPADGVAAAAPGAVPAGAPGAAPGAAGAKAAPGAAPAAGGAKPAPGAAPAKEKK